MKKINKLEIGLVICTLCLATVMNVNGFIFNTQENASIFNSKTTNERFIAVPDSTILLKFWDERSDDNMILPFYSISLDNGKTFVRTVQPSYELGFRYAHFDPLQQGVPLVNPTLIAGSDTHLFIVQFVTQPLEEFKEAITSLGGIVHHYIAQYAYLVKMSESVRAQVEVLPYVRWIGPYHPAYRLEEFMLDNLENAYQMYPLQRYNIQVLSVEQKTIVAERIETIGGIVDSADAGKLVVVATLTPDQLFTVVSWDEVNFVDRWGPYEADMDIVREIGGANYIESVAGYNGSGVRGEVFDGGYVAHNDFKNRVSAHGTVSTGNSHGAACLGINFGNGTVDPLARGLLPKGIGFIGDYDDVGLSGSNRYTHTGQETQDPYYCVYESASVGTYPQVTQYTIESAEKDTALFDFDILHCQSQSNTGNQNSRAQAWAKNVVAVGGVYHYNTLTKADDAWAGGASIGPAADGRIKPDLCHFNDQVYTTYSTSSTGYGQFTGTSCATPVTAGHFGLFFQMWSDGIFGNEVTPGGTVFENRPHMTTAKAMMINTADQYPFNGTLEDHTRMHQGWGMASLKNLYDLRDNFYIVDESDILDHFDVSTHIVSVQAGSPYLKVTMTYADPAGNPAVQTQHRINDLSLKVISPSSVIYWGNNGLKTGVWSQPDGTADTKDTVECIFIQNPEAGTWTVQVSADEIIQDSHVETPELDADYALVVSPVLSAPFPPLINGSTEGDIGRQMDFTFVTTDPGNSSVDYWVEWGDGSHEEWFGPFASGAIATISHTWSNTGNFSITAKAKNILGIESDWSEPFIITIIAPKLEIGLLSGGLFKIKTVIKNTGAIDIMQIQWNITLTGGAFFGKKTNGTLLTIPSGGERAITSGLILGFGKTIITVAASYSYSSTSKSQNATILLFFIKL